MGKEQIQYPVYGFETISLDKEDVDLAQLLLLELPKMEVIKMFRADGRSVAMAVSIVGCAIKGY